MFHLKNKEAKQKIGEGLIYGMRCLLDLTKKKKKGIVPPDIRRGIASEIERYKQLNDLRHPLHGKNLLQPRTTTTT